MNRRQSVGCSTQKSWARVKRCCRLFLGTSLICGTLYLAPLFGGVRAAGAATPQQIAALALANVGKGAGTCSQSNSSVNSLGGDEFDGSCSGNDGQAEFWCADFAKWVWQNEGLNVAGLDAEAGSFVTANVGTVHTSSTYVPQVGDAVVYDDYNGGGFADHVGLVVAVNDNGMIQTVNGDWNGTGDEVQFSDTSSVQIVDIAAGQAHVGSTPSGTGMEITQYVTPYGLQAAATSEASQRSGVTSTAGSNGSEEELYATRTSGNVWDSYEVAGRWSPWEYMGGNSFVSDVTSAAGSNGSQQELYATDASGHVWDSYEVAGQWSPWEYMGGNSFVSDVTNTAGSNGSQQELYVTDASGNVWESSEVAGRWSAWSDRGGAGFVSNVTSTAGSNGSEEELYATDALGNVWDSYEVAGRWSAWSDMGGARFVSDVTSTAGSNGSQQELYATDASGNVWDSYEVAGRWSAWSGLAGAGFVSDVTSTAGSNGSEEEVYATDASGNAWDSYEVAGRWSPWSDMGGARFVSDVTSTAGSNGSQQELYATDASGNVWDSYEVAGRWSAWELVS